ncbi:hypothetical protein D5S17_07955 [Pseudonocardiaceae bacterium YIM PH 21723]|nr:hypothetical protein D5S17_07955 [Pseudonocardiaceae bacterium YIM PH 21723]
MAAVAGILVLALVAATGLGLLARDVYRPAGLTSAGTESAPPTMVGEPPGELKIWTTADVDLNSRRDELVDLLGRHFTAINTRNYDAWASTVVPRRVAEYPRGKWLGDFSTSRDGTVNLYRVEAAQGGALRLMLSFVSTQDLAHAPPDAQYTCLQWRAVYSLIDTAAGLRLDSVTSGSAAKSPC